METGLDEERLQLRTDVLIPIFRPVHLSEEVNITNSFDPSNTDLI